MKFFSLGELQNSDLRIGSDAVVNLSSVFYCRIRVFEAAGYGVPRGVSWNPTGTHRVVSSALGSNGYQKCLPLLKRKKI